MQNLKIRVNSEAESKEAQELFLKLGYKDRKNWTQRNPIHESIQAWEDGEFTFSLNHNQVPVGFKEITLPELRAMVNPMKEYLEKQPDGTLELVLRGDLCKDDDIEVPEGMNYAYDAGSFVQFTKQEMGYRDSVLVWQRDQDEPFLTPESILEERKIPEIYGTSKAEPDFNDQYAEIEQVRQHKMKEYLIPSANYKYQKAYPITSWKEWVEIPEGAEWAKLWDKGASYECVEFYRGENEFFSNSSKKWMRGADQSTNKMGQPATIIWNRHDPSGAVTLHGTVKAETDLNFGAAQASGGVDVTLAERQSQYGCYEDVAHVTQQILSALRVGNYDKLPAPMKESLHMIASKMARIVNGDPEYLDNWHDIGGYAKLIEKLIKGE